jgi:hypothetical protein
VTWVGDRIIEEAKSIAPEDAMDEILQKIKEFVPSIQKSRLEGFVGF